MRSTKSRKKRGETVPKLAWKNEPLSAQELQRMARILGAELDGRGWVLLVLQPDMGVLSASNLPLPTQQRVLETTMRSMDDGRTVPVFRENRCQSCAGIGYTQGTDGPVPCTVCHDVEHL